MTEKDAVKCRPLRPGQLVVSAGQRRAAGCPGEALLRTLQGGVPPGNRKNGTERAHGSTPPTQRNGPAAGPAQHINGQASSPARHR